MPAEIVNSTGKPLTEESMMMIDSCEVPSFRTHIAIQRGFDKKFLIRTMGGIGDYVTAEPAMRWALNRFPEIEFSLATECPDLFEHLKFHKVYNLMKEHPIYGNYLVFKSYYEPSHLHGEFISAMLCQAVDYHSLAMWRCMLLAKDKSIKLVPSDSDIEKVSLINPQNDVIVHPGKSWASKTFPVPWWNKVIETILGAQLRPVLIGFNFAESRGTLPVDYQDRCLVLVDKLTRMQTVAAIHRAKVILTNDSFPLHIAASSPNTWIGFVSTAKHPEFNTHWRNGQFGWRMHSFGDSLYESTNLNPAFQGLIDFGTPNTDHLLPDPVEFAKWGIKCTQTQP